MSHAISHLLVAYRPTAQAPDQRVTACIADGMLQLVSPLVFRQIPLDHIPWREAKASGRRRILLEDGSQIHAVDALLWDAWLHAMSGQAPPSRSKAVHRGWLVLGTGLILFVAAASGWHLASQWPARANTPGQLAAEAPAARVKAATVSQPQPGSSWLRLPGKAQ